MAQAGLKHDPDVGIQYDATLQFLQRRRSGGYDETDSALEIGSEQDISGNAWQSRDLINKTIKRRAGCRQ